MSVRAAHHGDERSTQIMVAIFVDAFRTGEGAPKIPCPAIVLSVMVIFLAAPPDILYSNDDVKVKYSKEKGRQLRRLYPDVVRCCLEFLAAPRTKEQRARVCAVRGVYDCACALEENAILAEMHKICVTLDHKPLAQQSIEAMSSIVLTFYASLSGPRELYRLWRTPMWNKGRPTWPKLPGDLFPCGIHETLLNISAWTASFPSLHFLRAVETMHAMAIHPSHNAAMLTATRDTLIALCDHALSHGPAHPGSDLLNEIVSAVKYTDAILNLSRECFVGTMSSADITAWKKLVHVLIDTSEMVVALLGGQSVKIDNEMNDMLFCAVRLAEIFQFSLDDRDPTLVPSFHRSLITVGDPLDRFSGIWTFVRFLHPFNNETWTTMNALCANPACDGTKMSRGGRNLHICAGCCTVYYCSRACQKAAWRHRLYPHREVCKALHILSERISSLPGAHHDAKKFRKIYPGGDIDKPLAVKLGRYLAGIYAP